MSKPEGFTLEPEPELERDDQDGEKAGGKKRDEPSGARTRRRHNAELRERLGKVLERAAEWREARGDHELAAVLREDKQAIIGGLVSLTGPFLWLYGPLIAGLQVLEPVMAFGRVLRIMGVRMADRRARRQAERELELEPDPAPEPPPAEPWRA